MKYFLIAGEASGDLHGSNLMKGLKKSDPQAAFRFFGGDLMKAEGGLLLKHYREMAFMGAIDVIANIRTIKKNFTLCKNELIAFSPDVLILIDYPGFNLKIAEFAKHNGLKVFYYIFVPIEPSDIDDAAPCFLRWERRCWERRRLAGRADDSA